MSTNPKAIAVAQAIKQSMEQNAGPGAAINSHPNAFFVNATGAIDLYKAAEAALARIEHYEQALKDRFEFEVKALAAKIGAELKDGAASVEDAVARAKVKAGGELLAGEGVLEETVKRIEHALANEV